MNLVVNEIIGAMVQVVLFAAVPFVCWLIAGRKKEKFFSWIGLKKGKCDSGFGKTLLVAIVCTGAYIILTNLCIRTLPEGITKAGSQFAGKGMAAIPAAFVYAFIRTGLSEEILFRGFLLKRIASKFGFVAGNTVQAIAFGLLHGIPFGMVTGNLLVTVLLTLLPGAFGWILGLIDEKRFEGSILPSWMIHGTLNFITTVLAL